MSLSKHNIITPIADSEDFFIVNPLYNSADIISNEELKKLEQELDENGDFAERGAWKHQDDGSRPSGRRL
jgi:hypothetical protein